MTTASTVRRDTIASPFANRLLLTVVSITWLVVFFDGIDTFVYGAVLPGILADTSFHMTPANGGEIGSLATFGMLIGALSSGALTDAIGRKKMLIASCALFSVACAICAAAPTVAVFGSGRFIAGLGLGGLLPTAIAIVSEFAPPGKRNFAIGVLMTAHQIGGIASAFLGLALLNSQGWRTVFWVGVIPMFVAIPLIMRLMPESLHFLVDKGRTAEAERVADRFGVTVPDPHHADHSATGALASVRKLFSGRLAPVTVLLWLTSFMGLMLVYGVSTWLPTLMRSMGFELGSALTFLIVVNLGGVFGLLTAGRFADRRGPMLVAALWFAATAVFVFLLGVHLPLLVTYAAVFAAGFFLFSGQTMVYAATAHAYPTRARGTALGAVSGIGRFGAVFGPWLGGVLLAGGHDSLGFTVFAAAALIGTITMAAARGVLGTHVDEE